MKFNVPTGRFCEEPSTLIQKPTAAQKVDSSPGDESQGADESYEQHGQCEHVDGMRCGSCCLL